MPAAAVIPAPIAYINVVAVKKLVVEVKGVCGVEFLREVALHKTFDIQVRCNISFGECYIFLFRLVIYCEKIRVFKASSIYCLYTLAWNNIIGFHSRFAVGLFMKARLIGTVGGIHIQ